MKIYIFVLTVIGMLLTQGCSQKKVIKPTKEPMTEKPIIKKPEPEKILEVKNLDELDKKIAIYLNIYYAEDIKEPLIQNSHYDLEYVVVNAKTYIFIKFKNSFMFCGSGGCSAKMLEYKNDTFEEIESFSLIKSSIYLIHEKTPNGFSKVVIPVSYIDGMNWATYYNIYEPFSQNEIKSIYPKDIGYRELKIATQDRKKSIKLFGKVK